MPTPEDRKPVKCAYPACKVEFLPTRKDKLYHSARCKMAHWNELNRPADWVPLPVTQSITPDPVPTKLWLSIDEASRYSGLPKEFLIKNCQLFQKGIDSDSPVKGTVRSMKFGSHIGWRIHRASLEAL
jgi:hypothetical protein